MEISHQLKYIAEVKKNTMMVWIMVEEIVEMPLFKKDCVFYNREYLEKTEWTGCGVGRKENQANSQLSFS